MILPVSPDSPILMRAGAAGILCLHIGSGLAGLGAGATALVARKGGRLHRGAGTVFLVAMLIMSGIGATVAPFLPQRSSVVPGLFTFYLVATGWMAMRRPAATVGRFELGGLVFALATVAIGLNFAAEAAASPTGRLDGDRPAIFLVFSALQAFAGALDARVMLAGGLRGAPRMARHIWRMCLALLIASFSFFIGQPKVFPPGLRGSAILFAPEMAVFGLMVFWLIRVRIKSRLSPISAMATPRREAASPM